MAEQLVPLTNAPNQTFSVQLTVDGQPLTLNLTLSFVEMSGWWQVTIADVNNNVLVASVPLLTGWYPGANLLQQYAYLKIGSAYLLNTANTAVDYPNANNLSSYSLLWADTPV